MMHVEDFYREEVHLATTKHTYGCFCRCTKSWNASHAYCQHHYQHSIGFSPSVVNMQDFLCYNYLAIRGLLGTLPLPYAIQALVVWPCQLRPGVLWQRVVGIHPTAPRSGQFEGAAGAAYCLYCGVAVLQEWYSCVSVALCNPLLYYHVILRTLFRFSFRDQRVQQPNLTQRRQFGQKRRSQSEGIVFF